MHPADVETNSAGKPNPLKRNGKGSPAPLEGKCGALLKGGDRGYCRQKPPRGKKRCKFHGGESTGPTTPEGKARSSQNALKHGLYAQALKACAPKEIQSFYDEIPSTTDLSMEIAQARAKVVEYGQMLARGERWILSKGKGGSSGDKSDSWSEAAISVDDLHKNAVDLLRRLVQAQADMHPGADLKGNLRIRVDVSVAAQAALDAHGGDDLDLVADQGPPEEQAPEDREPDPSPSGKPGMDGLD